MEASGSSETFVRAYEAVILQYKIFVAVTAAILNVYMKFMCVEAMGVEEKLHAFLILMLGGGEGWISHPGHFLRESVPVSHWIGGSVCSSADLDAVVLRMLLPLQGIERRFSGQPPYSVVCIPLFSNQGSARNFGINK
jgi:hypothetical protein